MGRERQKNEGTQAPVAPATSIWDAILGGKILTRRKRYSASPAQRINLSAKRTWSMEVATQISRRNWTANNTWSKPTAKGIASLNFRHLKFVSPERLGGAMSAGQTDESVRGLDTAST